MTVVIGIYLITVSGVELAAVGRLRQAGLSGLGWELTGGVLGVMTGVALVVWPGIGACRAQQPNGAALAALPEGATALVRGDP